MLINVNPQKEKMSRQVDNAISFLAGIIFYNSVFSLLQGEFIFSILSFCAVYMAFKIKYIFELSLEN